MVLLTFLHTIHYMSISTLPIGKRPLEFGHYIRVCSSSFSVKWSTNTLIFHISTSLAVSSALRRFCHKASKNAHPPCSILRHLSQQSHFRPAVVPGPQVIHPRHPYRLPSLSWAYNKIANRIQQCTSSTKKTLDVLPSFSHRCCQTFQSLFFSVLII